MSIVSLPLPSTLTNGNTADAGQVTADLLAIASNVNANAAANGVNNDITQLTALTSISSNVTFSAGLTLPNAVLTTPTIIGGTIDGTLTGVTQTLGTNNATLATMAALAAQAFSTALPAQPGGPTVYFLASTAGVAAWSLRPSNPFVYITASGL